MKLKQKYYWSSDRTYSPRYVIALDLADYFFLSFAVLSFIGCYLIK